MLIGAHVSTAGGLSKAIERGIERGCEAIQIFNQSPRMWRPSRYGPDDYAAFREAMAASKIDSVVIHAIYLINCAAADGELRAKSLASLVHALRVGDEIGADGVVLHPGSLAGNPQPEAMKRVGKAIKHVLAESERCPLLLENTAGHTGTLGRDFGELAELVDLGGGGKRLGVCLDSCHLLASGHEVRDIESLSRVIADFGKQVGLKRLRCLHVNDSKTPLGSNRDRHENLGDGELGRKGIATFLSEPRFEKLPAILEVPGPERKGPDREQVTKAKRLRAQGLKKRA
jgi:deoxyribonuclease-4